MHKKKIRIFLGSSIVEFARERDELELFIRSVSDKFEERYETKIVPLRCESVDGCMTLDRKQEQYNELIRESEMCFFIFFTKAGEFTREEFEVAYKSFVSSEGARPKIYVYFKNIPDGVEIDPSIKDFMTEIDKTFHHYYGTFDDIDTIKLRILLNLKIQEMDFVKVELDGESVAVDGEKIMKIGGVSEFSNSADLTERLLESERLDKKYFSMKAEYAAGGCSDAFYREYAEIAARRQVLADEIEQLRGQIFSLSLGLSRDEVHGEISLRQREAYRLLEQGDREGCLAVMAAEEVDGDYFRAKELRRKRREEEDRAAARTYIREHALAVNVLKTMYGYARRFEEIDERYSKMVSEALEIGVETFVVYDYADFLYAFKQFDKALALTEKVARIGTDGGIDERTVVRCEILQGKIYAALQRYDDAESAYRAAVSHALSVSGEESGSLLGEAYDGRGALFAFIQRYKNAEDDYISAVAIWTRFAKADPSAYERNLADAYYRLGALYAYLRRFDEAEELYGKALGIRKRLSENDPNKYAADLAATYFAFAAMYAYMLRVDDAEKYHLAAIEIRKALSEENPLCHENDLAASYYALGAMYAFHGRYSESEEVHLKALNIRRRYAERDPRAFEPDYAASNICLGDLYLHWGKYDLAEKYYEVAFGIGERIADAAPDAYERELVSILNGMGMLYGKTERAEKSEAAFERALTIGKKLAAKSAEAFVPIVVTVLYYYGESRFGFGDDANGKKLWIEAVTLAKTQPDEPVCNDYYSRITQKFPELA